MDRSMVFLLVFPLMGATFLDEVARKNEEGNRLFAEGQFEEALKRYRDAGLTLPLLWPPFSGTPTAKTIGDMRRLVHDILPKV